MRCPAAPKYCRAKPFSSGGSTHSRSMTRRIRSSINCLDKGRQCRPETTSALLEAPRGSAVVRTVHHQNRAILLLLPNQVEVHFFSKLSTKIRCHRVRGQISSHRSEGPLQLCGQGSGNCPCWTT